MLSLTTVRTMNRRAAVRVGSGGLAAALAMGGRQPAQAADAATLEANKAIVRRVFAEPLYAGNVEVGRALYATDVLDRGAWIQRTETMLGLSGTPITIVAFRETHPELTVTVEPVIAEADLVAAMATWRGSHPPAGTHVVGRTMHVFRLAKGQIVEQWSVGWEWLAPSLQRSSPPPGNPLVVSSPDR